MKELEIYVVQYRESDAIWVFASKGGAMEHIEDHMEKYMAEGEKVVWTWNCRDTCTVRLEDNVWGDTCDRGGIYTIRKDSVQLSEEDIEKLTVAVDTND